MKNITLKHPVKLKSGVQFDAGAKMVVEFVTDEFNPNSNSGRSINFMRITHPVSGESYKTANWSKYFTPPSVATMQRWSDSGIAKFGESYKTANWSKYFTPPSVATMQRWSDSGIAKFGERWKV